MSSSSTSLSMPPWVDIDASGKLSVVRAADVGSQAEQVKVPANYVVHASGFPEHHDEFVKLAAPCCDLSCGPGDETNDRAALAVVSYPGQEQNQRNAIIVYPNEFAVAAAMEWYDQSRWGGKDNGPNGILKLQIAEPALLSEERFVSALGMLRIGLGPSDADGETPIQRERRKRIVDVAVEALSGRREVLTDLNPRVEELNAGLRALIDEGDDFFASADEEEAAIRESLRILGVIL